MKLDILLRNARVRTLDPARPQASAVGIWGGSIVGLDGDLAGTSAQVTVDLRGATVVPGFHDAHCHTTSFGLASVLLDLTAVQGRARILAAVTARAAELSAADWVIGVGYGGGMAVGEDLHAEELDRAAAGRPVWLTHLSGHRCVVSTAALSLAGVTGAGASRDRGRVAVDAQGRPTGLLEETAMDVVKDVVGPSSIEQLADAIDRATGVYVGEGITSFTDAGIGVPGLDHSPVELAAYQLARETGRLHARAQLMVHNELMHDLASHPDDGIRRGLDLGVRTGFGDSHLGIGAMKVWVDGSGLAGEGASFDDDPAVLRRSIVEAHRAGWQVAAHAMGDAAVDLVLDALEEAGHGGPSRPGRAVPARHRIEHGGLVRSDQVPRLARLQMTVVPQPVFIPEFGDVLADVLGGGGRSHESFRVRSLLAAGVAVAGSSDRPVAGGAPLRGLQAMVERRTASGQCYGPDERVDAGTALAAFTFAGARAAHSEHLRGMVAARMQADLTVLAEDPTEVDPRRISDIPVLATLVAGQVVHDPEGLFRCA